MSYGQCIVIFRPKFLESDGIFCLVPLLVQQKKDEKYRENYLGDFQRFPFPWGGGGGTAIYGQYRYVPL